MQVVVVDAQADAKAEVKVEEKKPVVIVDVEVCVGLSFFCVGEGVNAWKGAGEGCHGGTDGMRGGGGGGGCWHRQTHDRGLGASQENTNEP
jgi:hypothetical protein